LSSMLSFALPLANDISASRRIDGVAIIAHCMKNASRDALCYRGQSILCALSDALIMDDCASSLAVFSLLPEAMRLVDPTPSMRSEPPKACTDAITVALRSFIAHIEHAERKGGEKVTSGEKGGEKSGRETDDEHFLTAVAISGYLPAIAQSQLILHLPAITAALEKLMVRAGYEVGAAPDQMLASFYAVQAAFVDVVRHAWPRIPGHSDALVRAALSTALNTRPLAERNPKAVAAVEDGCAELLVWVARCGERTRFEALLNGVAETANKYTSLQPAARVIDAVLDRLLLDDEQNAST
jgi:hypothetical protein